MENTISIEIPAEVSTSVATKFKEIEALIAPYTRRVTDDEKKSLLKVGDKTSPFIQKVQSYMTTAPEFVPGYMNVAEFNRDVAALNSLEVMIAASEQVQSMLRDTHSLAANDAYSNALDFYNSIKQAALSGVAKAKAIYEDLMQRFLGKARSQSATAKSTQQ